jgi:hypothetical protein
MNFQVVAVDRLQSQLRAKFHKSLSLRANNVSATAAGESGARIIESCERLIEIFTDEVRRTSRLLRAEMGPEANLGGDEILWDFETKAALEAYYFGGCTAHAYKNLAKRKWNFMAGRYTRYWYHDGLGSIRLHATREAITANPSASQMYVTLLPEIKEICVLQISRAIIDGRPEFIGDLVVVSLLEAPPYIAISYTWGDPEIVGQLWFLQGGWSIGLTRSTTSILENLLDGVTRVWIWIDAICINQSDNVEKSSQVSMMGDIYRQAQQVVVSLEEPDRDSEVAMRLLHKAADAIYQAEISQQWPDMSEIIRKSGIQRTQWVSLMGFFQRRWFSRNWIVQEVLLGCRPVVVCGKDAVPFDVLAEACTRIMTHSQAFSALLLTEEHLAAESFWIP